MIIFEEDWDLYPHVVIDNDTKNVSFLRYSNLLKSMGIKNYKYPLQLHDKDLRGVDPHAPNLSEELMLKIAVECYSNFYYYIREVARSPDGTEANPIPFKANRGNMALYWLFWNHVTTILIQIRQTGKSFSTDVLSVYLLNIRCRGTDISLLTKDDGLRSRNLDRLKKLDEELPFYLRQRTRNDVANTEEMSIKSLGNMYRGYLSNASEKMALKVGRGLTSPVFHIDEGPFIPNISIALPAALAGGTAARDIAEAKGDPYGIILTTTSGKKDDKDGAFIYKMVEEAAVWTEKFLDAKDRKHLFELVRKNSSSGDLTVNCTFNHRQLGYTDEWLKDAVRTARSTGEDAERDFGNVWTSGTQSSPLPVELTTKIRNSEVEPLFVEISSAYAYATRWYIKEDHIESYMNANHHVMSIDSSDAVGNDDIGMILRNCKTGDVTAAGNYNETNIIAFCEWLCMWLTRFQKLTLIIERRSTGAAIIDYLLMMLPSKGIDPFARLYNKAVQEAQDDPDRYKEISKPLYMKSAEVYIKHKKTFGFATSAVGATSRTDLYSSTLLTTAKMTGDRVKDKKTINQILSLVIKNGRVDHEVGGHDDMVISWLLSSWLLLKGRNLSFYGINPREVLVENRVHQEENNPTAVYNNAYQEHVKRQVENIIDQMKSERDPYIIDNYEKKIKYLYSEMSETDRQVFSIDELLQNIKESRRINAIMRRY